MSDKRKQEMEELVEKVFQAINGSEAAFTSTLLVKIEREHRTIQQSFFRAISRVIWEYGGEDKEPYTDLRNEASRKFCKEVREKCSSGFPYV